MKLLQLVFLSSISLGVSAQKLVYPQNSSGEKINEIQYFQIPGKINGNFLIFENKAADNLMLVYNNSMDLIKKIHLPFLPSIIQSVKFIAYPDFARIIYLYEKKHVLYCMAAKIDDDGKLLDEPILLDTSNVKVTDDTYHYRNFYGLLYSENKSKILIYKHPTSFDEIRFKSILFDDSLHVLNRSENVIYYIPHQQFFSNFSINNEGDWMFTREKRGDQQTYPGSDISAADLFIQRHNEDTFRINKLAMGGKLLNALALKVDNVNSQIIINSLYASRTNIEGVYSAIWNEKYTRWISLKVFELGQSIRTRAKDEGSNAMALDNYYITNLILRKDGGFVMVAEERTISYTSQGPIIPDSRLWFSLYDTHAENRWEFLTGSPRMGNIYAGDPEFGNILVLGTDSLCNLEWGNVVSKKQFGDFDPRCLSFATIFRSGKLDLIYNTPFKSSWLLKNCSVTVTGQVIENPLMYGGSERYIFMPSLGNR